MGRLVLIATIALLVAVSAVLEMNSPSGWTPGWLGRIWTGWGVDKKEGAQKAQMKQVFDAANERHAAAVQGIKDNMAFQKDRSLPGIVTGAGQGDVRTISPSTSVASGLDPQDVYARSRDIFGHVKEQQERLKQQQQDQMRDRVKK